MGFLSNEFLRNGVNSYRPLSFSSSLDYSIVLLSLQPTPPFAARAACSCSHRCLHGDVGTSPSRRRSALPPCVVVRGNDYYMVTIVIQLWVFEDIDQAKMISIQCHIGGGAAQRDSEQRPGPRGTVVAAYCIDYSAGQKKRYEYCFMNQKC